MKKFNAIICGSCVTASVLLTFVIASWYDATHLGHPTPPGGYYLYMISILPPFLGGGATGVLLGWNYQAWDGVKVGLLGQIIGVFAVSYLAPHEAIVYLRQNAYFQGVQNIFFAFIVVYILFALVGGYFASWIKEKFYS